MGTLMCSLTWILLSKKYYLKKKKDQNDKPTCLEGVDQPKEGIDKSWFLSVATGRSTRNGKMKTHNWLSPWGINFYQQRIS